MNEAENNIQKPKLCKLAVLSPVLAVFSFIFIVLGITFSALPEEAFMPAWVCMVLFLFCNLAGIIVGILGLRRIHKNQEQLRGDFMAILGILAALFLIFLSFCMQCYQ